MWWGSGTCAPCRSSRIARWWRCATPCRRRLGRRWIGIDAAYLAVRLVKQRVERAFGAKVEIIGEPARIAEAEARLEGDPALLRRARVKKGR